MAQEYEPAGTILRAIEGRLLQEIAQVNHDLPDGSVKRSELNGLEFALELVQKQIIEPEPYRND